MELLKQLWFLASADQSLSTPVEEGKKIGPNKPRDKHLNDVLIAKSKRGGRHYDPHKDYVRAKEKSKQQRENDQ